MKILDEKIGYEYRVWLVQGRRYQGIVIKVDEKDFVCNCTQYKKCISCRHIDHVRKVKSYQFG